MAFQSGPGFQTQGFTDQGPSGVSGSAAILEGSDLPAITAAIVATGTVAVTEGVDVSQATAFLGVTGTAAILETPDSVSGFLGAGAVGSGAIGETIDVVAASGNVTSAQIIATGTMVEGLDVEASAGNVASVGTGAIQEAGDQIAASGFAGAFGSASITETPEIVQATGQFLPVIQVSGAILEGSDAFAGFVTQITVGVANILEGPDQVTGVTGAVASIQETADLVAGAVTAFWNSQVAAVEGNDFAAFLGTITGVPFVPGNVWWWVPYGPNSQSRPRIILEKRTFDAHRFDVVCTNLLIEGATIASVDATLADQGTLTFGTTAINPATAYYEDGTIAPPQTVIQVEISGGTIPSYLVSLMCTVRIRFTDSAGNNVEATVLLNLTDMVTA